MFVKIECKLLEISNALDAVSPAFAILDLIFKFLNFQFNAVGNLFGSKNSQDLLNFMVT